jgi:peptidoglycan/LPS O-acetylase OafA/YrhL
VLGLRLQATRDAAELAGAQAKHRRGVDAPGRMQGGRACADASSEVPSLQHPDVLRHYNSPKTKNASGLLHSLREAIRSEQLLLGNDSRPQQDALREQHDGAAISYAAHPVIRLGRFHMRYIAGIDPLRFAGAASVIALHLGSKEAFDKLGLEQFHVLVSGNTGVALFYVISGFLITTLIAAEVRENASFNVLRFFAKRALRIFPLYYIAIAAYCAVNFFKIQTVTNTSLVYALFYSYNFIPRAYYDGWMGSFHTLATEEHFYLIYPVMWSICLWRRIPIWSVVLITILLVPIGLALSEPFMKTYFIQRWTFNAWGPILVGCMFGFYYSSVQTPLHHHNRFYFLPLFGILFVSQVVIPNPLTMAVSFGFLMLHLGYNQERPSVQFMNSNYARYLGSISYGIYIWQSVIIATGPSRRLIENPILAVATVLILSILSWHTVEKPLAKIRHNLGRSPGRGGSFAHAPASASDWTAAVQERQAA